MQTPVVLAQVTGTGHSLGALFDPAGFQLDHRADAVAIALGAHQPDLQPVAHRRGDVVQQRARSAQVDNVRIHAAVVIVVGEARAAAHALGREDLAPRRWTHPRTCLRPGS